MLLGELAHTGEQGLFLLCGQNPRLCGRLWILRLRGCGRWLGRRLLRPSLWGGRLLSRCLLRRRLLSARFFRLQPQIPFMFQVGGKLQILFADFSFRERRGGCLSLGLGGLGIQDGGTLIRFGRLLVGNSDAGFSSPSFANML